MSSRRYELSDFKWSIIEPLLPNKPRGVARVDDRRVLNGIYWRLRTGSPWADIPERAVYPERLPCGQLKESCDDLLQSFCSLAQGGSLGSPVCSGCSRL